MKRRKWIPVVLVLAALILAVLWVWRYRSIQAFYEPLMSKRECQYHEMGQFVSVAKLEDMKGEVRGGYSFLVESCQIMDYGTFLKSWKLDNPRPVNVPDRVALVSVVIRADEGCELSVYDLMLRGMGVSLNISPELLMALTQELEGTQLNLAIEDEVRILLPFVLKRQYFSDRAWREMDDFALFLYASELHGKLELRKMVRVNG